MKESALVAVVVRIAVWAYRLAAVVALVAAVIAEHTRAVVHSLMSSSAQFRHATWSSVPKNESSVPAPILRLFEVRIDRSWNQKDEEKE